MSYMQDCKVGTVACLLYKEKIGCFHMGFQQTTYSYNGNRGW